MKFDSIFLIAFGLISLIAGFLNKNILFWVTIHAVDKKYNRATNIIIGIISILIGLYLARD